MVNIVFFQFPDGNVLHLDPSVPLSRRLALEEAAKVYSQKEIASVFGGYQHKPLSMFTMEATPATDADLEEVRSDKPTLSALIASKKLRS